MFTLLFALLMFLAVGVFAAVIESADAQFASAITVVTTAETIAATGVPCSVPGSTCKVRIRAWVLLTVGTNTTSVKLQIYRGTAITGTLVSVAQNQAGNFTAGSTAPFSIECTDALANAGQAQYCVSVIQNGASANGTVVAAMLDTMVLSG